MITILYDRHWEGWTFVLASGQAPIDASTATPSVYVQAFEGADLSDPMRALNEVQRTALFTLLLGTDPGKTAVQVQTFQEGLLCPLN